MRLFKLTLWCSSDRARELGATHRAWAAGIVPGFFDPDRSIWIPRSDLLIPAEIALQAGWVAMRRLRREEPDFLFVVGPPL